MKQIIIFGALCLTLAQACVNATASSPVERPQAPNVSISDKSVWIAHADAEFILRFSQTATYELAGDKPYTFPAAVYQIEPGVWFAEWGPNWIKIFTQSGITNAYINGETYVGICGMAGGE